MQVHRCRNDRQSLARLRRVTWGQSGWNAWSRDRRKRVSKDEQVETYQGKMKEALAYGIIIGS
jgi:hypothetical protein